MTMTEKEIQDFVNDVYPDKKIKVQFVSNEMLKGYPAGIDYENVVIGLNETCYMSDDDIKTFILHEVGHLNNRYKSRSKSECFAQIWAIKKAEELGLASVKKDLLKDVSYWKNTSWNRGKKHRRYILAAKLFEKEYIMQKKKLNNEKLMVNFQLKKGGL